MRSLALLALMTLAALPLSAHDHWRERRPVVVRESCHPAFRWEERRCEGRWGRHGHCRRDDWDNCRRPDCDEERIVLRPLPRPILGRRELRIR